MAYGTMAYGVYGVHEGCEIIYLSSTLPNLYTPYRSKQNPSTKPNFHKPSTGRSRRLKKRSTSGKGFIR